MTADAALSTAAAPRTAVAVLGLHGVKRRWIGDTVRHGLRRGSAAWFAVAESTPDEDRHATLATCVYHALGLGVVGDLISRTAPGGYLALFESRPGLLPAILAFGDEPTGQEAWRRYRWAGPPSPALTVPYTKVERAGRTAGPWSRPRLFAPGPAELARVERELDRHPLANGGARLVYAEHDDAPAAAADTKLARFCALVAGLAEASLFGDRAAAGQAR